MSDLPEEDSRSKVLSSLLSSVSIKLLKVMKMVPGNISLHLDEDAFVTCEEASAASDRFKDCGSNVRHVLHHHQPELTPKSSRPRNTADLHHLRDCKLMMAGS